MARPKRGDKRPAILAAATPPTPEQGLSASTSSIARSAGVAEGSLFTYFPTKDALFNELFLELKQEVYDHIAAEFPRKATTKVQAEHFWHSYLDWGMGHPHKRHALAHLAISDKITEESRALAVLASSECYGVLEARLATGSLKDAAPNFATAILSALAETTMEFMARLPEQADSIRNTGFDAFWRATGK